MKSGNLKSIHKGQFVPQMPDGSSKYLLFTISPLMDENFQGFIYLIDDITNTYELKEKLVLSEEKYRNLVERANDGIFRLNFDGKFLFANKKILDVLGLTQQELLKKDFSEFVYDDYKQQFENTIDSLKKGEKVSPFTVRLLNKKKESIWFDLNLVTVKDNGKISGFEGIARDITESKLIEHQKRELEQLNLNILRSISTPHFVIDKRFSILHHNTHAKDLTGINSLRGKNFFKIMPQEFQKDLKEPFAKLFRGELNNLKHRIGTGRDKDEDFERVYEVSGYPFSTSEDQISGIFVLVDDITYHYKSEKKMVQADKLATIGKLASGVAHEIRNPLNIIRGVVQYIQETKNDDESISSFLKILKDEVNRVTLFLEDFLSLTRQRKLQIEKADINEVIESVLKFLTHEIESQKIELKKDYGKKSMYVFIDENQIRQVILNIIKNSIDAIGKRRNRKIMIRTGRVNSSTSAESIFIEIEDTGCGTTKKVASKVFEPFFSTKQSGSGLGLAICSEILKNHHGSITFESALRKGSKTTILLPTTDMFNELAK